MNTVGTGARAQETDGEFVVLKGSTSRKQGIPSWTSYKALRDQLVQEGKLADGPNPSLHVFIWRDAPCGILGNRVTRQCPSASLPPRRTFAPLTSCRILRNLLRSGSP